MELPPKGKTPRGTLGDAICLRLLVSPSMGAIGRVLARRRPGTHGLSISPSETSDSDRPPAEKADSLGWDFRGDKSDPEDHSATRVIFRMIGRWRLVGSAGECMLTVKSILFVTYCMPQKFAVITDKQKCVPLGFDW